VNILGQMLGCELLVTTQSVKILAIKNNIVACIIFIND